VRLDSASRESWSNTLDFDEEKFLTGAKTMLDGVKAFWDGLEADRVSGRAA